MSIVQLIHTAGLRHADYADAAVIPPGNEIIFLAGACPLNDVGETVSPGDLAAQTRRALENMDVALAAAGTSLIDVAFLRILVATTRQEDLGVAWAVVRHHFGTHQVPGTLQGVTMLGYPGQLVELEPIAARRVTVVG